MKNVKRPSASVGRGGQTSQAPASQTDVAKLKQLLYRARAEIADLQEEL
jgi:hypothetical protein